MENTTEIIIVIVTDAHGKTFKREWLARANRRDAIRWTMEPTDLPYFIDEESIVSVTITEEVQKKKVTAVPDISELFD